MELPYLIGLGISVCLVCRVHVWALRMQKCGVCAYIYAGVVCVCVCGWRQTDRTLLMVLGIVVMHARPLLCIHKMSFIVITCQVWSHMSSVESH